MEKSVNFKNFLKFFWSKEELFFCFQHIVAYHQGYHWCEREHLVFTFYIRFWGLKLAQARPSYGFWARKNEPPRTAGQRLCGLVRVQSKVYKAQKKFHGKSWGVSQEGSFLPKKSILKKILQGTATKSKIVFESYLSERRI